MSYTNSSANVIQNAVNTLNNSMIGSGGINITPSSVFKKMPTFKIEMFIAENSGFIMNLVTMNINTFQEMNKLFILNDVQNMGQDIQNILAAEILKS